MTHENSTMEILWCLYESHDTPSERTASGPLNWSGQQWPAHALAHCYRLLLTVWKRRKTKYHWISRGLFSVQLSRWIWQFRHLMIHFYHEIEDEHIINTALVLKFHIGRPSLCFLFLFASSLTVLDMSLILPAVKQNQNWPRSSIYLSIFHRNLVLHFNVRTH